jgi:hypothetical protein
MPQPTPPITEIAANQAGWSAVINANFQAIADVLSTYALTIATQGTTAAASSLEIQRQTARATPTDQAGATLLRVRVVDDDGAGAPDHSADATNATLAVAGGTTLVEALTATKDLVVMSDANGRIELDLTNATAETVHLVIGPAPLSCPLGDYAPTLAVTHAAP